MFNPFGPLNGLRSTLVRWKVVSVAGAILLTDSAVAQSMVPPPPGPRAATTAATIDPAAPVATVPIGAAVGVVAFPNSVAPQPSSPADAPPPPAPASTIGAAAPIPVRPHSTAQRAEMPVPLAPAAVVATVAVEPAQNWSVGAGIAWSYPAPLYLDNSVLSGSNTGNSASLGGLGGLVSVQALSPSALTFLERRVSPALFVLIQPEFAYNRTQYPNQSQANYSSAYALGIGVRWVANPSAPVEVGVAQSVYAGRASAGTYYNGTLNSVGGSSVVTAWATPTTTSFGSATAFVAERVLVSQLWVRISATFFRLTWSKSEAHFELPDGSTYAGESRKTFGAKFGFEPALSLRLAF